MGRALSDDHTRCPWCGSRWFGCNLQPKKLNLETYTYMFCDRYNDHSGRSNFASVHDLCLDLTVVCIYGGHAVLGGEGDCRKNPKNRKFRKFIIRSETSLKVFQRCFKVFITHYCVLNMFFWCMGDAQIARIVS